MFVADPASGPNGSWASSLAPAKYTGNGMPGTLLVKPVDPRRLLDLVQAHMWFNLAATALPSTDTSHRNLALRNRDLVARKMTPDEIIQAQKLAREWRGEPPPSE